MEPCIASLDQLGKALDCSWPTSVAIPTEKHIADGQGPENRIRMEREGTCSIQGALTSCGSVFSGNPSYLLDELTVRGSHRAAKRSTESNEIFA